MFSNISVVWNLIPSKFKPKFFIIIFFIILSSILEILGLGLILPVLTILVDPEFMNQFPALEFFLELFGNPSQFQFFIYGMAIILIVYVIKNIILGFSFWIQQDYLFKLQTYLRINLFSKYIKTPFEIFINKNTSFYIRNINGEIPNLVSSVLVSMALIITEVLVLLSIIIFLLLHEPLGGVTLISFFTIAMFLFQKLTKRMLRLWGEERLRLSGVLTKKIYEGFNGFKDLKIMGCENFFIDQFSDNIKKESFVLRNIAVINNIPRLWLEIISVFGIFLLILFFFFRNQSTQVLIPTIGIFVVGAFRILPSTNRILSSIQAMVYGQASLDLLKDELSYEFNNNKNIIENDFNFKNSIRFENLSFKYFNTSEFILQNINLNIKKNESVGLIGSSGSGKSTFIDLFIGLLSPTNGDIYVDGNIVNFNERTWQKKIGYVQQNIYLIDDSLKNNIALGINESNINERHLQKVIKSSQLKELIDSLPNGIDSNIGESGVRLSGGQRQRIAIARALYRNPEILILDEATSSLDYQTEKLIMDAIKKLKGKITIVIVAHRSSALNICDRIFEVKNGFVKEKVNN